MQSHAKRWICCQLGSREHYAIPRVLHREGVLDLLLTDYWARRSSLLKRSPVNGLQKLAERRHPELATARVEDLGLSRLAFDLQARRRGWSSWEAIGRRNEWFQAKLLRRLQARYLPELRRQPPGIFFAYSYAARDLLRFFRELGWTTILGQIDPAVREEEIVAAEVEHRPEIQTSWEPAPEKYWSAWREEVELSDLIVVNSAWSREALRDAGVSESKLRVVPLAYEKVPANAAPRRYPERFDEQRPLRVLFLGQLNLRKGIAILFEALSKLRNDPVEFWLVGPAEVTPPEEILSSPKVRWIGPVSRSQTAHYYREADVFLLPTWSDGFALTQLEAQAHGLPVIASRFCGEVVEPGKNGCILDRLDSEELARTIRVLLAEPKLLAAMTGESRVSEKFSMESLQRNLLTLGEMAPAASPAARRG